MTDQAQLEQEVITDATRFAFGISGLWQGPQSPEVWDFIRDTWIEAENSGIDMEAIRDRDFGIMLLERVAKNGNVAAMEGLGVCHMLFAEQDRRDRVFRGTPHYAHAFLWRLRALSMEGLLEEDRMRIAVEAHIALCTDFIENNPAVQIPSVTLEGLFQGYGRTNYLSPEIKVILATAWPDLLRGTIAQLEAAIASKVVPLAQLPLAAAAAPAPI